MTIGVLRLTYDAGVVLEEEVKGGREKAEEGSR